MNSNAIALAKQRLAQRRGIPQGAHSGAMAGHAPVQYNQPPMQGYYPPQGGMVPQGAEDGSMAGCGPGGWGGNCPTPPMAPVWGSGNMGPYPQNSAYLGIQATPTSNGQFCLSVTCGNKFFYGCGARSFTAPNQLVVTSIISGFNGLERTCGPDAGFDVAVWNTDDCWCPYDWGCFSNLAPLTICFDPVDTLSVLPFLNMIIVGNALNFFNDCWPTFPPGYGGFPGTPPGVVFTPPGNGNFTSTPGLPPSNIPVG